VHNFQESLQKSHEAEDNPIWERIYRKAFPDFVGMQTYREDGFWQRQGVDRGVLLKTSKQLLIDEKVRTKDYGDILLEYLSSEEHETPGWICKPLQCDYIAYLIEPASRCYLLPTIQLQSAWNEFGEQWIRDYKRIEAKNETYTTISCAVPAKVLFPAIGKQLRVQLEPKEVNL